MDSHGLDSAYASVRFLIHYHFKRKKDSQAFFDQLTENSALPAGMVKVKTTNKILSGSLDDLWTFLLLVWVDIGTSQ